MHTIERIRLLRAAMLRAGIGKGWRNRTKLKDAKTLAEFEAKLRRRAETDLQWRHAFGLFQASLVAGTLCPEK